MQSPKPKANQHESYGTMTLISMMLPIVGIILGIVYLTKDEPVDKKLGEHLIAFSLLFGFLWVIIYQVFLAQMFTPRYYYAI